MGILHLRVITKIWSDVWIEPIKVWLYSEHDDDVEESDDDDYVDDNSRGAKNTLTVASQITVWGFCCGAVTRFCENQMNTILVFDVNHLKDGSTGLNDDET